MYFSGMLGREHRKASSGFSWTYLMASNTRMTSTCCRESSYDTSKNRPAEMQAKARAFARSLMPPLIIGISATTLVALPSLRLALLLFPGLLESQLHCRQFLRQLFKMQLFKMLQFICEAAIRSLIHVTPESIVVDGRVLNDALLEQSLASYFKPPSCRPLAA